MTNHTLYHQLNSDIGFYFGNPLVVTMPLLQRLQVNVPHAGYTDEILRDYFENANDAQLANFLEHLYTMLEATPEALYPATSTAPRTTERLDFIFAALGISEFVAKFARIVNGLTKPVIVDEEFYDWYTSERREQHSYYWKAYRGVLQKNGWAPDAIASVNQQAIDVIRRLEDPLNPSSHPRRGLVVGYVQSGKTANFTAVMAKAIDAGYRMIIVLAGTLDNLRNQTQRRLDMELFGTEAVLDGRDLSELAGPELRAESYFSGDPDWDNGGFLSHGGRPGKIHGYPRIKRLTSSAADFDVAKTGSANIELGDDIDGDFLTEERLLRMPCYVAVVKKNSRVLQKLNTQLKRLAGNRNRQQLPVLIIDDESDQASVNTIKNKDPEKETERTAVNREVVALLRNLPRAQYVGYTATPFANVFINPEDPEDLYPKDFVLMLAKPKPYRGADWFHDRWKFSADDNPTLEQSNSLAFVRDLAEPTIANEEGTDYFQDIKWEEFEEALDMFVLTGAIKKFREAQDPKLKFKHHTMLVHESVKNEHHGASVEMLSDIWLKRGYTIGAATEHLRSLYEKDVYPVLQVPDYVDGNPVPASFEELIPYISEAVNEIVSGMPMDKQVPILQADSEGGEEADFERGKVWKILVGGAKLSRGYTVEGLTVSYFRRKAGTADTLMQTGRWFGFRKGYQDLVRLYAPPSLVEMFEASMRDEEQFREEVAYYADLHDDGRPVITPAQLAPLVQQTLPGLLPTARNKMFNAYVKSMASSPIAKEFNGATTNPAARRDNFEHFGKFLLERMGEERKVAYYRREGQLTGGKPKISADYFNVRLARISGDEFLEYFSCGVQFYGDTSVDQPRAEYFQVNVVPRLRYVQDLIDKGELDDVIVMMPIPGKQGTESLIDVDGIQFPVPVVSRMRRGKKKGERHDISGADRKHVYALTSISMGCDLRVPRKEELAELREYQPRLAGKFADFRQLPVPLEPSRKLAGLLLYFFDERDKDVRKEVPFSEVWKKAGTRGSEHIGMQFVLSTPFEALDSAGPVKWGVRVESEKDDVIVDATETDKD